MAFSEPMLLWQHQFEDRLTPLQPDREGEQFPHSPRPRPYIIYHDIIMTQAMPTNQGHAEKKTSIDFNFPLLVYCSKRATKEKRWGGGFVIRQGNNDRGTRSRSVSSRAHVSISAVVDKRLGSRFSIFFFQYLFLDNGSNDYV